MKKVAITGARGVVGTAIQNQISTDYSLTLLDLPEADVRDRVHLKELLKGHDAVIHLAWDVAVENYKNQEISPDNSLMAYNVLRSALDLGIPRVILASSIHADDYDRPQELPLTPYRLPYPKNPYGATKVYVEALGRYYASCGLEVICLRFGGVRASNAPSGPESVPRFLTHNDLGSLIRCCLEAEQVPGRYAIMYAVSANTGRIHDVSNPFAWVPKEDSASLLS